jgi:hypothetical protein
MSYLTGVISKSIRKAQKAHTNCSAECKASAASAGKLFIAEIRPDTIQQAENQLPE